MCLYLGWNWKNSHALWWFECGRDGLKSDSLFKRSSAWVLKHGNVTDCLSSKNTNYLSLMTSHQVHNRAFEWPSGHFMIRKCASAPCLTLQYHYPKTWTCVRLRIQVFLCTVFTFKRDKTYFIQWRMCGVQCCFGPYLHCTEVVNKTKIIRVCFFFQENTSLILYFSVLLNLLVISKEKKNYPN